MTDGDDTVNGTQATIGSTDVITDDSATDNDTVTIASDGTAINLGTMVGIENITVNVTDFGTAGTITATSVASGTLTVNNLQVGGSNDADVAAAGNITVVAGTGVTDILTVAVSAAAATVVNGGSAATVTVSGITLGGVSIVTGASTSAINVDGSAATTDTVSISASGAVALATAATQQVEALTLSGNGAAAVFTLNATDAPETVAFTGSQNVTLVGAAADFTTETFTNTSTGVATLRINNDVTSNLSNVATSIIIDVNDGTTGGQTYTLANNANVLLTNAAIQTFDSTALTTDDETINLTVQIDGTGSAVDVSDFEIVNVATATPTSLSGSLDLELVAGATSVVTLTGSVALALDTASVANTLNAAAYAGVITMTTTAANIDNLTFGTGDDVITVTTAETVTINGGAGSDTLVAKADMDTTTFSNFEILDATTAVTNMDSSQLATALIIINGDVTVDNANTAAIDLSIHTVDSTVNFTVAGTLDTSVFATTQGLTITGNVNADNLTGTANADVISGGDGGDTISGGAGADTLSGGAGGDTITGGTGADTLTGGAGADTFVFDTIVLAVNANTITDFEADDDILQFDATTFDNYTNGGLAVIADVATVEALADDGTGDDEYVIIDTAANIAAMDVTAELGGEAFVAIASDTGAIYYADDGDGGDIVQIGTITAAEVADILAANFSFVA